MPTCYLEGITTNPEGRRVRPWAGACVLRLLKAEQPGLPHGGNLTLSGGPGRTPTPQVSPGSWHRRGRGGRRVSQVCSASRLLCSTRLCFTHVSSRARRRLLREAHALFPSLWRHHRAAVMCGIITRRPRSSRRGALATCSHHECRLDS